MNHRPLARRLSAPALPWQRWALLGSTAVAVAIPFLAVKFAPIADLPQQLAQIRLLLEAVGDPGGSLRVDLLGPNRLVYALLGGAWAAVGPRDAGRLAMLALGILWVATAHHVARRRGRSPAAAALASLLFLSHATYWGFYAFTLGAPLFVLWVDRTDALPDRLDLRARAGLLGGALLLFSAHALWFAAGMAWLGVSALRRGAARPALSRLASVAPAIVLAAAWHLSLAPAPAGRPPVWTSSFTERLDTTWLEAATLGGLHGRLETTLLAVLVAWVAAGLVRGALGGGRVDRALLLAALLLAAAALVLPNKTHDTIRLAERWLPAAAFLALLAVPAPLPARTAAVVASAIVLVYGARTASAWRAFERTELSGLEESLDALPPSPSVVGVDLVKHSPIVRNRPFLQTFAWAQVLQGGTLSFSFTAYPGSLVRSREEGYVRGGLLVWNGELANAGDVRRFDHVLVNAATDEDHARTAAALDLEAVTWSGRFRLYRPGPVAAPGGASTSFEAGR